MNKKLLIAYALAAILVLYVVNVYRSRHHVAPPAVETQPVATPEVPVNQEAEEKRSHNEAMIKKYSEQITSGTDTSGEAYYQRGLIYLDMMRYRSAIQDFSRATQLVPESPGAFYARALAYKGENELELAINDLNTAVKLKSDFATAYNARAAIYDDLGKTDEAINDYKNAIAINPDLDQSYFNLGTIYQKQKEYSDALAEYTNAIDHNNPAANATPAELADSKRRLEQAYMNRATVYLITNELQAGLDDVNAVISSEPKKEAAYRLRSEIYNKMGNTAESLSDTVTADNLSIQNLLEH